MTDPRATNTVGAGPVPAHARKGIASSDATASRSSPPPSPDTPIRFVPQPMGGHGTRPYGTRRGRIQGKRILAYAILVVGVVLAVSPFLVTILASFKESIELVRGPFSLPENWLWQNYERAWTEGDLDRYFVNSIVVAVAVVVPSIFLSALSGYAFARFRFRGAGLLFGFLLLGLVVPLQAIVIPLFYLLKELGLLNSYLGLILPQIALSMSFGTLLMRQAFIAVPREIVEASIVDGANSWTTLWQILFPLARPIVGTLALMLFVWTWNEFLLPLVVSIEPKYQTLPVGLLNFQQQWTADLPVIAAGSTIIFLPLTIVFLIFQQQLVRGITAGAVKG